MLTGSRNLFEARKFDGINAEEISEFAEPIAYVPSGYSNTSYKEGLMKRVYLSIPLDNGEVKRLTLKIDEYLVKSLKNNKLMILESEAFEELLENF